MRRGKRRREAANAWRQAQERRTSSRCAARASGASEAMRQNTGPGPAGGLASQAMAAGTTACLPPPKADVPSHATWSAQDGPEAAKPAHAGMVCTIARRAARPPSASWETHRGPCWGAVPHRRATLAPRHPPPSRWPGHATATPVETDAWPERHTPPGAATPTRQGTADSGTPRPGTRLGSAALAADLWLAPRARVLGGHRSQLPPAHLSAPVRAQS
jgi:hypothetical protein